MKAGHASGLIYIRELIVLLKYRGTYRVMYEADKSGKAAEFTFIPCRIKKGSSICRHDDNTLNAYIPSAKIAHRLLIDYLDLFKPFQIGDGEATLLFNESDIEKTATIMKARVMGKGMNPKPKRKVAISDERKKELAEQMRELQSNKKNIGQIARKTGKIPFYLAR